MALTSIDDLFIRTLEKRLGAERHIVSALPGMEEKASSERLRSFFFDHHRQVEARIRRLETAFHHLAKHPEDAACDAILGLVYDAEQLLAETRDASTTDAALIAAAQGITLYGSAQYRALLTWARSLEHGPVVPLLEASLGEHRKADGALSELAEASLTRKAA